ncbi:MAG: riboflavin biosynthesis protein RibF [Bacteroidetes bacterium CG2_30_33_31]|nr:MAG: riboflavin biosynthesis protein RibF [Bacteroidetes bacterium CG2_30_33_31]
MKVFNDIEEVNLLKSVVTIGTFDGVHCGHKVIIDRLIAKAKFLSRPSMVITFEPHPRLVLQKNIKGLKLLTIREEKITRLNNMGIDFLLFLPFTYEFSQLTSEEFIHNYLIDKLQTSAMVIGYDHSFGKINEGKREDVTILLKKYNIDVERIPEQDVENIAVSSTKIRQALSQGDTKLAAQLLGYDYTISGTVIHGNKLGHTLGFPTANLMLRSDLKLLPADGVYAVRVKYKLHWLKGMLNIGFKPTFKSNERTIEVHIFDFDKTIYGEVLTIQLIGKIRAEKAFNDIEELKIQLIEDSKAAKEIL